MSRRKQANPKSFKDSNFSKLDVKNNKFISSIESFKLKENETIHINKFENKEASNKMVLAYVESEKEINAIKDDLFLKNMTNNSTSVDFYRKNLEKLNEEDIDVENYSDDNSVDNEKISQHLILANKQRASSSSRSRSRSTSASSSSSSLNSYRSSSTRQTQNSRKSNSSKLNLEYNEISGSIEDNQLSNDLNNSIEKREKISKLKRQRFYSNYSTAIQKQNATSILINGKRYYQLKFLCENCGLRYSDQSTLNTHKLNYCSKKPQNTTNEQNSLKELSTSRSESEKSRSNSPQSFRISLDIVENENNSLNDNNCETKLIQDKILEKSQNGKEINIDNNNQAKTIIYQCNNCLFQTDKKSIMNKHSRVHLPQKRKAMEESTLLNNTNDNVIKTSNKLINEHDKVSSNASLPGLTDKICSNDISSNEKSDSYCKDCDIQFSSMKTYLHHRNIYCQKYKTIELSPNDARQQALILSSSSKESNKTIKTFQSNKNIDESTIHLKDGVKGTNNIKLTENPNKIKNNDGLAFSSLSTIKSSSYCSTSVNSINIPKQQLINSQNNSMEPPNAVCMGDLVYLPVYKINNRKESETSIPLQISPVKNVSGFSPFNTPTFSKQRYERLESEDNSLKRKRSFSNSTDISLKIDDNEMENDQNNDDSPLDLSIKNKKVNNINKQNQNIINNSKSQKLINIPYLNELIQNENDSNENFIQKKQKINLPDQVLMKNNYNNEYQRLINHFPINFFQGQETNMSPYLDIASQTLDQNLKYQKTLIELANYQKLNYSSHLNDKKDIRTMAAQSVSNKPQITIPLLEQNNAFSHLNVYDKIYRYNNCKEYVKQEKGNKQKCIVVENILNQKTVNSNFNQNDLRDINTIINRNTLNSSIESTLQSRLFSKFLVDKASNSRTILNKLDYESNESSDDHENQKTDLITKTNNNKLEYYSQHTKEEIEELLNHPLVKKTLSETYGDNTDLYKLFSHKETLNEEEINNNRYFYICTNCGYRGNTSRGVKQHGKIHLSNKEHFAIINVNEKFPFIIYNSKNDSDIKIPTLTIKLKQKNELDNFCLNSSEINNSKVISQNMSKQQQIEADANNTEKQLNNDMKSETYCFKCGIQFQHIKNFLAHKKSYCNN